MWERERSQRYCTGLNAPPFAALDYNVKVPAAAFLTAFPTPLHSRPTLFYRWNKAVAYRNPFSGLPTRYLGTGISEARILNRIRECKERTQ